MTAVPRNDPFMLISEIIVLAAAFGAATSTVFGGLQIRITTFIVIKNKNGFSLDTHIIFHAGKKANASLSRLDNKWKSVIVQQNICTVLLTAVKLDSLRMITSDFGLVTKRGGFPEELTH